MVRYLIQVWGCVEPELHGPFTFTEERDRVAKDLFGDEHAVFKLFVEDGVPSVESYSGAEVEGLIGDLEDDEEME